MRVERYASEGGLRVFDDQEREIISRLGREGETRISLPGLYFDYDKRGDLVFAAFRATEVVVSPERGWASLSSEFLDLMHFMREEMEMEIVARIEADEGRLIIGVGDSGGVVAVGQPLKVNLELLEGDFYDQAGLAKIGNFIKGKGF